ncbi:unnamed protein product [Urochloa humidicola]
MATGRQGAKPQQQAAEQEFDPKYEWQENATSFILRLHLSGFRKEDFKVQVDGSGRLTVRGQRADAGANAKHSRFNKIFQLPASSNLDAITGRFDAGVLTLTVPKKAVVDDAKPKQDATKAAPPPPPQEQAAQPKKDEAKKPQAERKEAAEMTTTKKPKDDAKPKEDAKKPPAAEQQVDAKRGKPEQEQRTPAPPPAAVRKEEAKAEAEATAPPTGEKQDKPKPPQADGERKAVDPESLAAVTARRRAAEDEKAKATAAAAAEEAGRERPRRGLKERVQEQLEGLAGSEWAEGVVETVKKNKEVIAVAVAAFSLGLFVSNKLFCRNN